MKKKRIAAITELAGIAAAAAVYFGIYIIFGVGMPCPFRAVTGLLCPGCGMTHAVAAILHGDPGSAMEYNMLSTNVLPAAAFYLTYRVIRDTEKGRDDFMKWEYIFLSIMTVICLSYGIVRNLR